MYLPFHNFVVYLPDKCLSYTAISGDELIKVTYDSKTISI